MNLWLELGIEGMAKFRKGQYCGNQKRNVTRNQEEWGLRRNRKFDYY